MTNAAGEARAGHVPSIRRACFFSTALGWMATAWSEHGLAAVTFGHRRSGQARRTLQSLCVQLDTAEIEANRPDDLAIRLRAYAEGEPDDFRDVPLDLGEMTDFQRRVSLACRRIDYGQTRTYADLAARIGSPGAARAVGNVMARNRLPIIIPCHRVVGSAGALGGYSAPGGLGTKRWLLRLEGSL